MTKPVWFLLLLMATDLPLALQAQTNSSSETPPPAATYKEEAMFFRPFASLSVAGSSGFGYLNPDLGVSTGFETSGRNWLQLASFSFERARKLETRDGAEISASLIGMLRLKRTLAGGALRWAQQSTSLWKKSVVHPQLAGGFELQPIRVVGRYVLAGNDHLNGATGLGVDITYTLSRHFRLQSTLEALRFYPTGFSNEARQRGTSMSIGVEMIK